MLQRQLLRAAIGKHILHCLSNVVPAIDCPKVIHHEKAALRRYLLNGGFMMVDDFWGEYEWDNLAEQIVSQSTSSSSPAFVMRSRQYNQNPTKRTTPLLLESVLRRLVLPHGVVKITVKIGIAPTA